MEKCAAGRVIRRLGPLTFLERVRRQLRYVHIDQLLRKETVNIEDEDDEVVPDELAVPMSVPDSVLNTQPPSPSTGASKTNLNQRAQAPIPVAEPASQSPARNSPTQIPVAVSESGSPPQAQHYSETVPKNSPMKTERRHQARQRKALDGLNL